MQRILVWDLPTRVFHWTLAACFALAWLTSESDVWLSHHVFLGYVMLGLVGFRVLWGVLGGHYARFAAFRYGPKAGLAYLRDTLQGRAARHIGHNPAGSQAIYLLLLLVLAIGVSGIFTLGGEEQHGAVAGWFGINAGRAIKQIHEATATFMLLVVAGHIAAVVIESLLHKENLARSMLTGFKLAPFGVIASKPYRTVAALLLLALAGFGFWWFFYALQAPLERHLGRPESAPANAAVAFVGPRLADNALWRDECGSCHLAFHPSLLPKRSWQKLLAQQDQHFGADLGLNAATTAVLLTYATNNAADKHRTEPAFKIDSSIAATAQPLRITETPYWIRKHQEIAAAQWARPWINSKANCEACHQDAQAGTFEDAAMHIPSSAPTVK
jgi:cytochrome b